jgi:hypothetical protein
MGWNPYQREDGQMLEAKVDGQLVQAGPDSPERARCPACGSTVTKRKRSIMGGGTTYFYRHVRGEGKDCPLRYSGLGREAG